MSLDVALQPINVIIPDSCSAHRSKTNLLLLQLGDITMLSQPKEPVSDATRITPQDLYNTIQVSVQDVAIGFVGGRVFASHTRCSNLVTEGFEDTLLVKPFDVSVSVDLCLVNEVRSASMLLSVAIRPILLNVTKQVINMAANWAIPVLTSYLAKQKELDIDLLSILLLPKQLLFSCLSYEGSIFLADHAIDAWADSPDRLHKTLLKAVREHQSALQQDASWLVSSVSDARAVTPSLSLVDEEPTHGVVHLSYEDLLLLQYKPSMVIDLKLDGLTAVVFSPEDSHAKLMELQMGPVSMSYQDHLYDMDITVNVPSFAIRDYTRSSSQEGYELVASTNPAEPFLQLHFASVGELSMLNEVFQAATVVIADVGPISGIPVIVGIMDSVVQLLRAPVVASTLLGSSRLPRSVRRTCFPAAGQARVAARAGVPAGSEGEAGVAPRGRSDGRERVHFDALAREAERLVRAGQGDVAHRGGAPQRLAAGHHLGLWALPPCFAGQRHQRGRGLPQRGSVAGERREEHFHRGNDHRVLDQSARDHAAVPLRAGGAGVLEARQLAASSGVARASGRDRCHRPLSLHSLLRSPTRLLAVPSARRQ